MNGATPKPNGATQSQVSLPPLKILIVGAGIGGLFAAISLRNAGHSVSIYESSRFAVETGAAIHLPPNVNGLLRRIGMNPEDYGAVTCEWVSELFTNGERKYRRDLGGLKYAFPYPWQLCHRIDLHNALKDIATKAEGEGKPAVIHLQSRVAKVNVEEVTITLQSGETVGGDLTIGADGVHSVVRKHVLEQEATPYPSGTSAFRFLIPTDAIRDDPATAHFVEKTGELIMINGDERRLVMYPCRQNTEMNFVAMHPDSESEGSSEDWNQTGSLEVLLKVFDSFSDDVKALLRKARPETIKLWKLLDHEALPSWTNGRIALLGDAAHPFLPHQGQGGAQAIEDAAALGALFPLGTLISDIPGRLKLYTECRYERATTIQTYSRDSGFKIKGGKHGSKELMDPQRFAGYNFDHDAYDNAFGALKRDLVERAPFQRMPVSFGPNPGPRQNLVGVSRGMNADARYHTAYMTFKTKKSYLQTLMPTKDFRIQSQGGWTTATFSVTRLDNLGWLGGRGYSHFGFYIHNVAHTGTVNLVYQSLETPDKTGDFLPVLFENMTDPITTGREELGFSKVFATLQSSQSEDSYVLKAGWEGTDFCQMSLSNLVAEEDDITVDEAPIYHHNIVSSSSGDGKVDAQYTTVSKLKLRNGSKEKRWKAGSAKISFHDLKSADLERAFPTLANIIDGLQRVEISEVVACGIKASQ